MDQSAALPYRAGDAGDLQILLITSHRRQRWIIPKGNIKPGLSPSASAMREAFEEAGVIGTISLAPVGEYQQEKREQSDGSVRSITIRTFALAVSSEVLVWPEMRTRERRWFTAASAIDAIADDSLRAVVAHFVEEANFP